MFRFPSNQSFELFEVHAGKKYGDCRSVATSGGNWMELVLSPLCIYHSIPRCLREIRVFTPDLGGFYML
jgi:hypothetical protein